jgi:isopenicillin N synthase-like dioxygenase
VRVEPNDLRPFRDGSDEDRRSVAAALDHSVRTTGFFSLARRGIGSTLIAEK